MSNLQINNCSQCELKNDVIVGLIAEIRQLKAENSNLIDNNIKLEDKLNRLIKQVSSNSSNSSSTHTHTLGSVRCSIAREIAEYMENNDTCKDARLFLLPIEEFSDGVYNRDIDWEDGME